MKKDTGCCPEIHQDIGGIAAHLANTLTNDFIAPEVREERLLDIVQRLQRMASGPSPDARKAVAETRTAVRKARAGGPPSEWTDALREALELTLARWPEIEEEGR